MTEKYKPPLCIVCLVLVQARHEWDIKGVEFRGSPGYGSRFDCTLLAHETLVVVVCDGCLKKQQAAITLRVRAVEETFINSPWTDDYDCNRSADEALDAALRKPEAISKEGDGS